LTSAQPATRLFPYTTLFRSILRNEVGPTMARAVSIDWAKTQADPRGLPAYSVSEAAHYLRVPRSTLRAWVAGQTYQSNGTTRLLDRKSTRLNSSHVSISYAV